MVGGTEDSLYSSVMYSGNNALDGLQFAKTCREQLNIINRQAILINRPIPFSQTATVIAKGFPQHSATHLWHTAMTEGETASLIHLYLLEARLWFFSNLPEQGAGREHARRISHILSIVSEQDLLIQPADLLQTAIIAREAWYLAHTDMTAAITKVDDNDNKITRRNPPDVQARTDVYTSMNQESRTRFLVIPNPENDTVENVIQKIIDAVEIPADYAHTKQCLAATRNQRLRSNLFPTFEDFYFTAFKGQFCRPTGSDHTALANCMPKTVNGRKETLPDFTARFKNLITLCSTNMQRTKLQLFYQYLTAVDIINPTVGNQLNNYVTNNMFDDEQKSLDALYTRAAQFMLAENTRKEHVIVNNSISSKPISRSESPPPRTSYPAARRQNPTAYSSKAVHFAHVAQVSSDRPREQQNRPIESCSIC